MEKNRVIKFRVYDEGRMKYPEEYKENRFDNYFIDLNGQLRYYQNCYDGGFFDTDNAKLMQFTGQKDENGKEIYEGDVVKYRLENHQTRELYYENFTVVWNKETASYVIKNEIKGTLCIDYVSRFGEVIGNIYENPELWKGADNIE